MIFHNERGLLVAINRLISVSLIIQTLISLPLWWPSLREFPLAPMIPGLNWANMGTIMYITLLVSLVLLLIRPLEKRFTILVVVLSFLLVLEDENRLQPWLYLYAFMLLSSVLSSGHSIERQALYNIFLILGLSYFWSGVQKVNLFFGIEMFPWLAEFTGQGTFLRNHPFVGCAIGMTEGLAGLCLFIRKLRKMAGLVIILMHSFILIALGPLGHNWNQVVWPWNICFATILSLLIWSNPGQFKPFRPSRLSYRIVCLLVLGVFPVAGIFGHWDHFLSGGFYSCVVPEAIFYYHEDDRDRIPSSSVPFQMFNRGTQEEFVLLDQWALDHLKVPVYPEMRTKKKLGAALCDCVTHLGSAGVRINSKDRFTGKSETIELSCEELKQLQ